MCKINLNESKNGIELSFDSKPEQATIDAIKAHGFRWSRGGGLWWAKQTPERLQFAATLGELEKATTTTTSKATKASKPDTINLDNLGSDPVSNHEYSTAIREAFKARGVKGCTVRQRWSGYTPAITVTVKATAEDIASIEEAKTRYSFSEFCFDLANREKYTGERWTYPHEFESMTDEEKEALYTNYIIYCLKSVSEFPRWAREKRNDAFTLTSAFYDKLNAVFKIANQWNYDHSDIMTDYFDIGYYLDIDIKKPAEFEPRQEMTEEERTAYAEEIRRAEEEEEARRIAYEIEREEARKASEEAEKRRKADEETVNNNCIIEDLDESEQLFITNLVGGVGKESTLEEVDETISRREADTAKAYITRKVIFTTGEAFEAFGRNLLSDFIFLSGKGGTGSDDVRLENIEAFWKLNEEQRSTIDWCMCDCVAIYNGDKLELIVNPEGHHYARYTYRVTESSEIRPATEETNRVIEESKKKAPFYFPADVVEQCERLEVGQEITIYQCDGWILNSINAGSGIVTGWKVGKWAQYDGVYINLTNGKKNYSVFIRNGKQCLIYEGIKDRLPESITRRQLSNNMYEVLNYTELFPLVLEYYAEQGQQPIIDTWQR